MRVSGTAPRRSLLEFDSVDAAKEWYYSNDNEEVAKLRQGCGRLQRGSSSPGSDGAPGGDQ